MIDITNIVSLVVELAVALITAFVIPYIKKKITAEKYNQLVSWATVGVQAAEMIFKESGMGASKKAYVIDFLRGKGYCLDEETLNAVIESAVLDMKNEIL